jgi:monoterpene epsilon-lactone hydrolase
MASPAAEAIKAAMGAQQGALNASSSLEEWRAMGENGSSEPLDVPGVNFEEVDCAGVRALWVRPEGAADDRVVEYLHGGGYAMGSARGHGRFTAYLAAAIGCPVLSIDYRLSPEHPFPAQLEDSVTAFNWLVNAGVSPNHIAIAGDSAGGGLTLSTLLKLRDDHAPLPAGAVAISPWSGMLVPPRSYTRNAHVDPAPSNPDVFNFFKESFLHGHDGKDPYASPLYGDYTGISPLYIQVGGDEQLLDDSTGVAEKAKAAGVEVEIDVFPEMWHVFQLHAGTVPEADDAVARIARWLRPRLEL